VLQYQDEGFLPQAVLNYLIRLGWSHGDREYFSIEEMVRLFDIVDVNKSAATFDVAKLTWLNQQHMMHAPAADLVPALRWQLRREGVAADDDSKLEQIVLSLRERTKTMREMAESCLFFFRAPESYDPKAVRKHVTPDVLPLLGEAHSSLARLEEWSATAIHECISAIATAHQVSLGKLAQPIRLAVCGGSVSPPIDATLAILGKAESLARMAKGAASWSL
jgi:glutamyl-tRNA synthetase